jgi:NADH-quinone oxidoreductase subunit M
MVYGSMLTMAQTDIKRIAACSTISQISYSVFGIAAMTAWGIQGGMFYFLSHILGKAVLFSTAGILVYRTETRELRRMGGLWSKMPLTAVLWMCASLILSALPPTSGFVGKWMMFGGAFRGYGDEPVGLVVIILAVLSTLLTLVYTFLTGIRIFFGRMNTDIPAHSLKDPPPAMSLPLLGLSAVAFVLGVYPDLLLTFLESAIGAG